MPRQRFKMRLDLTAQPVVQCDDCRAVSAAGDLLAVSQLMLDAYRGTIDDDGETLEDAMSEVQKTFASEYGTFWEDCSFLIERDGQALSAILVTLWREAPIISFVMTHPSAKNQGLAALLIKQSINALLARGYTELYLFVTKGNLAAQHLYEKLGFRVVSTGFVAEVNGAQLGYEMAGAGQPLVLLHSGLADSRMWDSQFEAFARQYRVIRYDLRGYGRSTLPPEPFSHRADLAALLGFLEVERAILVGSSLGGQVAIDFTLDHPELVAALVTVGAGISGSEPSDWLRRLWEEIDALAEQGDTAGAVELELRLWVDGPARTPEQVDSGVRELIRQTNSANMAREAEQALAPSQPLDPPALNRLGEIRAPTLVVVGALDIADKLAQADQLAAGIAGAHKVVMPGTAHLPSLEQPERFNRILLAFLNDL